MNQLSRILGRAFAGRRFYNHRDLEKVESPEPRCSHLFSPLRRFLGRIGEPVAMDDNTLNNPFETTDNRGRNTMGLLQRSTVSSRALGVVFGVLLVVSVPAAWSTSRRMTSRAWGPGFTRPPMRSRVPRS